MNDARSGKGGHRPGDLACLALVALLFMVLWRVSNPTIAPPSADALRYLDYAVNLAEANTFGLTPRNREAVVAGRANTPLYPAFVGLVMGREGSAEMRCYLTRDAGKCPDATLARLINVQLFLAAITATIVSVCALLLWGQRAAWFALAAVLLSGELQEYAYLILTENLVLLFWSLLTLSLVLARSRPGFWFAVQGLSLGGLTLTRPEFLYLGFAFVLFLAGRCLRSADKASVCRALLAVALSFVLVVGPWSARNVVHFEAPALTASYAGRIIAQRTRYNHMSVAELGTAFVYWLPDFGDSWARRLFDKQRYERLGFGPGTYYSTGLAHHDAVAARIGGEQGVVRTLLREDVLAQPFKHAAVSLALAWRAIFVAKLWGLVALSAFAYLFARRQDLRPVLLSLSAPAWFMLALYANVSVSVPRYAVCFVPVFALALAAACSVRRPSDEHGKA